MSTYTVTEERPEWWAVMHDGAERFACANESEAIEVARNLNLHASAEAMLALLVETLAENRNEVFPNWEARRDALIRQINGEATCGRCGNPFAPFEIAPAFLGLKPVMSAICPECTAKRQAKTEAEER